MSDRYFGERWDAPAFDHATQVPTPVRTDCTLCNEKILEGDSGTWLGRDAVHIECFLRMVIGSPAHVTGLCACSGGEEPQDDRTWREQGLETMELIDLMKQVRGA